MTGMKSLFGSILLAVIIILVALPAHAEMPTVVATSPENGQTGVDPDLSQIILDFSKPMSLGFSINGLEPGFSDFTWSNDNQRLTITKDEGTGPSEDGTIVELTLNPPPYYSFLDAENNPLGTYFFSFTMSSDSDPESPVVVSTSPGNGATDVEPDIQSVSVTFSKSMSAGKSVNSYGNWQISETTQVTWSEDGRTATISRDDAAANLAALSVVRLILNQNGDGFEDTSGHILGTYSLAFTIRAATAEENPTVVSISPGSGSFIGQFTDWVAVTFSKEMQTDSNVTCNTGNWDLTGAETYWSTDQKTFYFSRANAGRELPAGETCQFTLNSGGASGFRDMDGNPLDEYSFSFTIETPASTYRVLKILPEDSSHDFSWPYYLSIPDSLRSSPALLVEPNNTGTTSDDQMVHDMSAYNLLKNRTSFASDLKVPLLVPTFPRPYSSWQIYTHALDRECLTTDVEGIERIDLQLIEMIEDAIERLKVMGIEAKSKVYIMGFSASGMFTNRFTILHPDRVLAAAIGSPGGWPIAPVASWQGETLDYHVGIADLEELTGSPADMDGIKSVPMFLYMGDQDTNDSVPYGDSYDDTQREQVNRLFGTNPVQRWPNAEAIYTAVGCNSEFKLYPGVTHTITEEMYSDIKRFFIRNSGRPSFLPGIIINLLCD